ncbi:MAG: DNA/RNA nuclease SfsA [Puniceicoccales bacterium]|jgi:sugar fermentation stimulation protein A|nr:DNA/RNA nuclease SfsA [Puniceicoccales bacterium]
MPSTRIRLDLKLGKLISRPNRFIFDGIVNGQKQRWHCPVTGKIGKIANFDGIPCLFTPATPSDKRLTQGTVEAIHLPEKTGWIGINQNRINGWFEEFLRRNAMLNLVNTNGCTIHHEVMAGGSRLDLVVKNGNFRTFVELKTPTHDLLLTDNARFTTPSSGASFFERLIRHYESLCRLALGGNRTILVLCFMYDAPPFIAPPMNKWNEPIMRAAKHAQECGVENWQVNLRITPKSLKVMRYFCINRQYEF